MHAKTAIPREIALMPERPYANTGMDLETEVLNFRSSLDCSIFSIAGLNDEMLIPRCFNLSNCSEKSEILSWICLISLKLLILGLVLDN